MPATAVLGGSALVGSYLNYRSAKKAGQRTPEEQNALTAQTGVANDLRGQSSSLFRMAQPALGQASRYYSTLASGSRGAMTQALAPEIQSTNDVYGGTRRTLARFLRGPDRDYQLGELERQRAGAQASLFREGRTNAVARLLDFGQGTTASALGALGGSAGVYGNVGRTAQTDRLIGSQYSQQAGQATGDLLMQLLQIYSQRGRGGRGRTPSFSQGGGS